MSVLGDWYHERSRAKKARWITAFIAQHGVRSALVVGVNPRHRGWENKVELAIDRAVPYVLFSGMHHSPDARPYVAADGRALPFRSGTFDLVYSNAVVEHVGARDDQQRFLREHARVGRHWVATTPNRWFPVESHTLRLFRHWSPAWRRRQRLFTRLLSIREFREVLPAGGGVVGTPLSPTFFAYGDGSAGRDVRQAGHADPTVRT